ncbi:MAG: hypothetical protein ACR2OR_08975 [Hyphomicrobiales bacterium]
MFNMNEIEAYAVDIGFWLFLAFVLGVTTGWFYARPRGWRR